MSSTGPTTKRSSANQPLYWALGGGLAALLLLALWMSRSASSDDEPLETQYGRQHTRAGARSVNGATVLAELFRLAGHRVSTEDQLYPSLMKQGKTIVWIPDDFAPPTKKQRDFLEQWLAAGESRTLIYVGRDFDAAPLYFDAAAKLTSDAEQSQIFIEERDAAQKLHAAARATMPERENARWFTVEKQGKPRNVRTLQGPWAAGVDAAQVEIQIDGRLVPPPLPKPANDAEASAAGDKAPWWEADNKSPPPAAAPSPTAPLATLLLSSEGDALVTKLTDLQWADGQAIIVTNGSFLLNYPLVNHEHRKLAAKLVAECGSAGDVIFLDPKRGGPAVLDQDPEGVDDQATALQLLQIWPLNVILIHAIILGIILCLALSPIFGRPKELPLESPADFGKHITALGQLFARTKDRVYAQTRLLQYQQQAKRGSGKTHKK